MTTAIGSTTSSTASTSSSSTSSAAAEAATVDYNSFLQLLVQELKNQDPTSPSDPTQYLSQLASFSNVEQGVNTNTKLDTLLTTSALTQAETMIGKTVTSSDGKTSGVVTSVALGSGGSTTATLTNGETLTLDSTVSVSGTSSTSTSTSTSTSGS
jgi:flagellar basal-body rod modification protein FlgD